MAGFSFTCYRTYDKNVVAIMIDFSADAKDSLIFSKRKLKTTLILVDTGIGDLPEESSGLTIIKYPDEQDNAGAEEWWTVFNFRNATSLIKESPDIGKVYLTKECYSYLHSMVTVYSIQDIIEALKFLEKEDIKILQKQKKPYGEIIEIINKRINSFK